MACILCCSSVPSKDTFSIYDFNKFTMVTAEELIKRYFTFHQRILSEVTADDSLTTVICRECWVKLDNFHEFFLLVQSHFEPEEKYKVPETQETVSVWKEDVVVLGPEIIKQEELEESAVIEETVVDPVLDSSSPNQPSSSNHEANKIPEIESEIDQRIRGIVTMSCNVCSKSVQNFKDVRIHMRKDHGCSGYLICCEKKFYDKRRLVDHVNSHLNCSYKCPVCSRAFTSKSNMYYHVALHDENKPFQCAHCDKTFARKFQVKSHLLSVHALEHVKPSFQCPEKNCNKKFVNEARLKSHVEYSHMSKHKAICEICSKLLRSPNALNEHMKIHSRKPEDRVKCEVCGNFLANVKAYRRHKKNHETEHLDNTCEQCGKKSPNSNALKIHIRYVHEAKKKFQCRYCEKSFKRPRDLVDHEASVHTLQELYECSYCDKTFRNQSNMLAHRKKQHPDQYKKPAYKRDDLS